MAKRNLTLMKKTTAEPEIVDEKPEATDDGYVPVEYDAFDDSPPDFVKPLSAKETKRRAELEGLITRNFKAFYDVGCALREIQQRMLYRETRRTFADYSKELWDMARRTAYGYIEAADVVDNVRNCAQNENVANCQHLNLVPNNENQARALTKFEPDQQRTIWTEAVQTATDGKITAAHINAGIAFSCVCDDRSGRS